MSFRVIGRIEQIQTIATSRQIRELDRLHREYGPARWRKRKGFADIAFDNGATARAELHWYEASEFGRIEMKIKQLLD